MKKNILLFLIFISASLYAAENDTQSEEQEKEINLRVFVNAPLQNFTLNHYRDNKQVGDDVQYKANSTMNLGFGGSYKSVGGSFFWSAGSLEDEETHGKTKSRDVQLYFYTNSFGSDLYYQQYKGCYLADPSKFGYSEGDSETIRPDIEVRNTGANFYYSFFDDYSLSASFKQMEKSYKSAGSPLVSFAINEFYIKGDSSLVPLSAQSDFGEYSDYRGGKYRNLSVGGGYGYTEVFSNNIYLAGVLMAGCGYMYAKEDLGNTEKSSSAIAINVNLKLSVGYNGDTFYCGLTGFGFSNGTSKSSYEYTNISCMGGQVEYFAGIRI